MHDRVPGKPGQYRAVITTAEVTKMQAGQPFTITMARDDEPVAEGTPYSKAAVLPDSLAQLLCPDIDDPTLADALASLAGVTAIQLLDNGDFVVNQRGLFSYTGTSLAYTVDRWYVNRAAAVVRIVQRATSTGEYSKCIQLDNTAATNSSFLGQRLETSVIPSGAYTIAAKTDEGILYRTVTVAGTTVTAVESKAGASAAVNFQYLNGYFMVQLIVNAGATVNVEWAALYKGAYNVDTLPPYTPKGYGAELLECQRYYQIRSTGDIAAVDMQPLMRAITPTVTALSDGTYSYSADL